MKKTLLPLLMSYFFVPFLSAQNHYFIGFRVQLERNWLISDGFDNLNNRLASNNVVTLKNVHGTGGYTFYVGRQKDIIGVEFSSGGFTANALSRDTISNDVLKPTITGRYSRFAVTVKLYEKPRLRLLAGLGGSSTSMELTLTEISPKISNFNNAISSPSLSPSLIYQQPNLGKIETFLQADYRTKLLSQKVGEFSVGMRVGYAYQTNRKREKIEWRVKNTQNEVSNFPLIIMDNLSIQLNVGIAFYLASSNNK